MIQTGTFRSEPELVRFLHINGIEASNVFATRPNSSGTWTVIYEDGQPRQWITGKPGSAGLSYAGGTNVNGDMLLLGPKREVVAAEDLGAIVNPFTATLANAYVMPGTVTLVDSASVANTTVVDDGWGWLVRKSDRVRLGTIDYATGDIELQWYALEAPAGNVLADYEWSDLPFSSVVPFSAELSVLVIELVSGAAVTSVDWAVYEDEAAAFPPIAEGTSALNVAGEHEIIDLGDRLSTVLDTAARVGRWLKVTPDDATNEIRALLHWKAHRHG